MKKRLVFLLTCLPLILAAQITYFVKEGASGTADGTNWQNAFPALQSALQIATSGDQIWVAKGLYKPSDTFDRNSTFLLPLGVSLWGGFSGVETTLTQRDILANPTILSGDIGVPDVRTDNVYHVITILGGDSLTIVDGLLITKGNADGANNGGALSQSHGGGILIVADVLNPIAAPKIRQCRFEQNRGLWGGGIACLGDGQYACVPVIEDCSFVRNRGEIFGAGVYKEGINLPDIPFKVEKCLFEHNYCHQIAGGIAIINPSGVVQLYNCTFTYDSSKVESGAVYFETQNNSTRYEIESCLFNANFSFNGCSGLTQLVTGNNPEKIELSITNSRFLLNHNFLGLGGAVASIGGSSIHKIDITGSRFENNFSQNPGAGIYIEGDGGTYSDVTVDRCFFLGNQTGAASIAGAFYYRGFGSSLVKNRNTITNSVFMFNDGAIASLGGKPGITNTRVANCSFYNNGENPFVKYWGVENNPVDLVMTMQFLNCVIWEPQTDGVQRVFFNNDAANFSVNDYLVEHSLIHLPTCVYNGVDPCGTGMIYGQWPDFINAEFGNTLEVWPNSPIQNKGSNLVADTFGLTKDYWGKQRICGDTVDMGAYEMQILCTTDIFETEFAFLPVGIRLLKNPLRRGELIEVELFAAMPERLIIQLIDPNGHTVWQEHQTIMASTPHILTLSSTELNPGLYFVKITDENGRYKTEKLVVI